MNKDVIECIMTFMMRVNLSGNEVPAFNYAMKALEGELIKVNDQNENSSTVE